jgi:hypothetical protein
MSRTPFTRSPRQARLLALLAVLGMGGCASLLSRTPPPRYGPQKLRYDVIQVLDVDEPSPGYYRQRARLEVMGPQLDSILAQLAADGDAKDNVRANAVTLLADRSQPGSVAVLRGVLSSRGSDAVRAAAAAGLQRFAPDSPAVKAALRGALHDPSDRVRLGALQGMDVEDVAFIRGIIAREESRQVRTVARQLVTLFEARGAPLVPDSRGDLRTTGDDTVPRIVFHPTGGPSDGLRSGALWAELPGGRSLVPLAPRVEVAADVVPAFFDPQRRVVVFEGEGQVRVRDLRTGATRAVGEGLAPRPIPFTERFVFLREVPGSRHPEGAETVVQYTVLRASFAPGAVEAIGTLQARISPTRLGGASPARTVIVGEATDGFVLRGEWLTPFVLPGPYGQ